jgi:glycosyltransferase involved in cell wall biosynthesis
MPRPEAPKPIGYVLRKFPVLSETFVLNEMLGLEERGIPLHVFSLMRPNDPRFHDDLPKLKARVSYVPDFFDLAKLFRHNRRLAKSASSRFRRTLLYVLRQGNRELAWRFLQAGFVANEARRLKIGHLHAQFANRPTTVAMLASRLTGIPYSFTAHATDIFKHRVDRKVLARKVEESRFVVTVSDFNRSYLRDIAPEGEGKLRRVLNGIDVDRFAPNGTPPHDPFRILCVARLVEKKGLPHLIEACRLLDERGVDFECVMVGKGRLRSPLAAAIKDAGLRKRVLLAGPKTQGEILEEYHRAHVYALPAIVGSDGNREGLPVSIVEALSCGLPVVSTTVTGIPEAVHDGHNGLLVEPGDPVAFADALESVARDRNRWDHLRANARPSVVEDFDRRRTIEQLHQLLNPAA